MALGAGVDDREAPMPEGDAVRELGGGAGRAASLDAGITVRGDEPLAGAAQRIEQGQTLVVRPPVAHGVQGRAQAAG
jgi:hypothetical protein